MITGTWGLGGCGIVKGLNGWAGNTAFYGIFGPNLSSLRPATAAAHVLQLYDYKIYTGLVRLYIGTNLLHLVAPLYMSKCSSMLAHSASLIVPLVTFEYTA
jgi:hypothetical protein